MKHLRIRKSIKVFNTLDDEDAKMMYLAYKLNQLPETWQAQQDLTPNDFVVGLDGFIRSNFDYNWSAKNNDMVVMTAFAKSCGPFILLSDPIYHPKASSRQKLECAGAILNEIRKDFVGLIHSEFEYKKFYEKLMDYKILRRVGTMYDTQEKGSRSTVFQTRMR